MRNVLKHTVLICAAFIPVVAVAENFSATIAAGHPPVFRWVKMLDEVFVPAVNQALADSEHKVDFSAQYGGSIAGLVILVFAGMYVPIALMLAL